MEEKVSRDGVNGGGGGAGGVYAVRLEEADVGVEILFGCP